MANLLSARCGRVAAMAHGAAHPRPGSPPAASHSTPRVSCSVGSSVSHLHSCPRHRIHCDACEAAVATVVCYADEAALCVRCDVETHTTNKLASKHQRLPLALGNAAIASSLPRYNVCQEKDRVLFCRDCDEPIHVPESLSGNHLRYLATGIRVGFNSVYGATGVEGLPSALPPKGSSKPPVAVSALAAGGATKITTVKDMLPQEVPSSPF